MKLEEIKNKLIIILNTFFICICFLSCSICKIDTKLPMDKIKINEISSLKTTIYTEIVINSPAKKVWETLMDFDKMPNWSTTIKGIYGEIQHGGSVIIKVDIGNGQIIDVPRSPLIYKNGEFFGWSGEIKRLTGISDHHIYKVEAISKCQTRFIQTEEFTGSNPNITTSTLANQVIERYKTFNNELKKEVERK